MHACYGLTSYSQSRLTFQQPHPLDRHALPHKLLARQDQLVIEYKSRWGLSLEQRRGRVDIDSLIRFGRPVPPVLLDTGRVEKVSRTDGLLNRYDVARVRVGFDDDFDSFAETGELVPDVPDSTERFEL
jgi:hypothetical protein